MLCSGCCMKHDVNFAMGIFHPRTGHQGYLYIISDVATIIYQCCDGPVHIYLGGYLYIISDVATIIYQCSLYNSKIYIRKAKKYII